jgi:hypothetical protein
MTRYEFASYEWLNALEAIMREAVRGADSPPASFVFSECFTKPPDHLTTGGRPIGFTAQFEGNNLRFTHQSTEAADVYIEAEYEVVQKRAQTQFGGITTERTESMRALIESGRMTVRGDFTNRPSFMHGVHDMMAGMTL